VVISWTATAAASSWRGDRPLEAVKGRAAGALTLCDRGVAVSFALPYRFILVPGQRDRQSIGLQTLRDTSLISRAIGSGSTWLRRRPMPALRLDPVYFDMIASATA
jgi:hypothetical protein